MSSNPLVLKAAPSAVAPKPARILFVLDGGVAKAHPDLPTASRSTAAPTRGRSNWQRRSDHSRRRAVEERSAPTERVLQAIHDASLDRHSYVVAIGGGAVLDVVGYAAATAHRGIRLIRIPTTVLAQDDSAVGVKNGINAFGKKNYLGRSLRRLPWSTIRRFSERCPIATGARGDGGGQGRADQGSHLLRVPRGARRRCSRRAI